MFFLNRQIFKNVIIFYLVIIMLKEIDKVIITSNENIENELFELFCSNLIKAFNEIKDWFNVQYSSLSLTLVSKSELNKIAKEKSESYKNADVPDWLVGFSNFEQIWIVTPTLETLEEMIKVALHELIHLISYKLDTSNRRIKLLDEGIAVFLSNQNKGRIYTPWVNAYLHSNLPEVSDFCSYDSKEFAQKRWI